MLNSKRDKILSLLLALMDTLYVSNVNIKEFAKILDVDYYAFTEAVHFIRNLQFILDKPYNEEDF